MIKPIPKKHSNGNCVTLIISITALVLATVAVCAIWQMDQNMKLWVESDFRNDMETNKRHARFEFCFNNNIRPCDDISLKEFNNQPENKANQNIFNLWFTAEQALDGTLPIMREVGRIGAVDALSQLPSELVVYEGWSDELAAGLVAHSREAEILKRVPKDAMQRFADEHAAHEWYMGNEITVYTLGEPSGLAGVIWFSRNLRPELGSDYTFAVRMYEQARGKRLSAAFVGMTQYDFETTTQYKGGVWLVTDATNTIARHLYERSGYVTVGEKDGRVTMVRKGPDSRT
jgi:hypothetical protein